MGVTVALILCVAALAAVGAAALATRRRAARDRRRAAALASLAERVDAAVASLGGPTAEKPQRERERDPGGPTSDSPPLTRDGGPGRVAFLDALDEQVERARAEGSRLATALVRATGDDDVGSLAEGVREVADTSVYAVGPRSVAIVLPGLGRADALGVLARIEARRPSSGRAVELEPGESAVELVTRLLAAGPGTEPGRHALRRPEA